MNPNGYVTCNLKGGLGNQLFQICTTLSYAKRTGRTFVLLNRDTIGDRPAYFNTFFSSLQSCLAPPNDYHYLFHSGNGITYEEREFEYHPIPDYPSEFNVLLDGYFQCEKYFCDDWSLIANTLWENKREKIMNSFKPNEKKTIGLHFRMGDYVHKQNCHPVMPVEYYINSLKIIVSELEIQGVEKDIEVLYFCENQDLENVNGKINKLQSEFPNLSFKRSVISNLDEYESEKDKDWRELIMFGICDANIIANSSFSWWGVYLGSYFSFNLSNNCNNSQYTKPVCYPSLWFGPALQCYNTKDLCLTEWYKINV